MVAGLGTVGTGCSVLEELGTNPYEANYFQLYSVVSVPTLATPAAESRRYSKRSYGGIWSG